MHAQRRHNTHTKTWARLAPTIETGDPEDLCDVHGNDIQAAGSSLGQESDHRLQKLWVGRWRHVSLCYLSSNNEEGLHSNRGDNHADTAPVTKTHLA